MLPKRALKLSRGLCAPGSVCHAVHRCECQRHVVSEPSVGMEMSCSWTTRSRFVRTEHDQPSAVTRQLTRSLAAALPRRTMRMLPAELGRSMVQPHAASPTVTDMALRGLHQVVIAGHGSDESRLCRACHVLTRGHVDLPTNPSEADRQFAADEQVWQHEIQPKLARLSSHGRQLIVEKSGHRIHEEAPEAVVAAVRAVLAEVRYQPQ